MTPSTSFFSRAWLIIPALACGFVLWTSHTRKQRIDHVTGLPNWSVMIPAEDFSAPTGFADDTRSLLVPEQNAVSFQWIAQTQQMFALGEWRVRRIDYENAPRGRDVQAASPYRWWLGLVAAVDHVFSGRPIGHSVERAALGSDPVMHLLLLIGTTAFVAWQFGALPAALASIAIAALFPFAGGFVPGLPNQSGMERSLALASLLLLLAGTLSLGKSFGGTKRETRRVRLCFLAAGIIGGLGLWISVPSQLPILIGLFPSALVAAWVSRTGYAGNPTAIVPWRMWAIGGAATSFAGYLIEYFPGHMTLSLEGNHPVYALAWLGAGEILHRLSEWIQQGRASWAWRDRVTVSLALACVAAWPAAHLLTEGSSFLGVDPHGNRLSLATTLTAENMGEWLVRDGIGGTAIVTVLPLLFVLAAAVLITFRKLDGVYRAALALSVGPVAVTLVLACYQLRLWNLLDATLISLVVITVAAAGRVVPSSFGRGLVGIVSALALLPGAFHLIPVPDTTPPRPITQTETEGLIIRDLAHWFSHRHRGTNPIVLASPDLTSSLHFFGSIPGIGTLNRENEDGITAAIKIATATTDRERRALIEAREITHIVLSSWDTLLDQFVQMGQGGRNPSNGRDLTFIARLRNWNLSSWLRPVPYRLPKIPGLESHSLAVFEIVEEQTEAVALGRQTEYFMEMGMLKRAASLGGRLQEFPTEISALIALAQMDFARDDTAGFNERTAAIQTALSSGFNRRIPWDRRVSLAIVLADGKNFVQSREQTQICLETIDRENLRSLTPRALARFRGLVKVFKLEIEDVELNQYSLDLLPPGLAERL